MELQKFKQGDVIIKEGSIGTSAYVIESGIVEVSRMERGGKVVLATLGKKQIIGEMGLIDDQTRSATVIALVDTKLRQITRHGFNKLFEKDPKIVLPFVKALIERLKNINRASDAGKNLDTAETAKVKSATPGTSILDDIDSGGTEIVQELYHKLDVAKHLFYALDTNSEGSIQKNTIMDILRESGIQENDFRIQETIQIQNNYSDNKKIGLEEFRNIVEHNISLIDKVIKGNLIIPNFEDFCAVIRDIFDKVSQNKGGSVTGYIPELRDINPDQFGLSICTIDGQRLNLGDYNTHFCVQSSSKALNYCVALDENGEEVVHKHIGREPSGRRFNELILNEQGLPHNPMINSGAIMACSLIKPQLDMADRVDYLLNKWADLGESTKPGINETVCSAGLEMADRNFAISYFMRENGAFPKNTDLHKTIELYYKGCSIEMTSETQATVAATLANSGICPTTGKKIFDPDTAKNCLSLMYSCGMYDYSGEFAFKVGVPAKSGVSGVIMIVIPNVMGITVWSPRIDVMGNSVCGIEFCHELVKKFNFHSYDSLIKNVNKTNPRIKKNEAHISKPLFLCWAAYQGDLDEIKRLVADDIDINITDYDGRTALHLAAAENYAHVVNYLVCKNVDINPKDRWGETPLSSAYRGNHKKIVKILEKHGAKC
jgi:glutaminase